MLSYKCSLNKWEKFPEFETSNREFIMKEKIDLSLDRSLVELVSSYWEFKDSDEITTEEESEFGALEDCLEGMGFVTHLM